MRIFLKSLCLKGLFGVFLTCCFSEFSHNGVCNVLVLSIAACSPLHQPLGQVACFRLEHYCVNENLQRWGHRKLVPDIALKSPDVMWSRAALKM